MPIKLKKEHIRLSEVLCSQYCRTTAESDIIVPDIKPDISKVLQITGNISVTQKNIQTDYVYIQGVIRLNILYIPDGDTLSTVKSITAVQDFAHRIDIKGARSDMELFTDAECDPPEYNLINSRKLNVRCKIGINVKITVPIDADIATDTEGDETVQICGKRLNLYTVGKETERDIIIRERHEIPDGNPSVGEILKVSAHPISAETKIIDGKALLKGEIGFCILYAAEDETGSLQVAEYSEPFNEILEAEGFSEGMSGEAEYSVKDIYSETAQDNDGDRRVICVEATLCARLKTFSHTDINAIADAYSTDCELITEKSSYRIEQLVENSSAVVPIKERFSVPDNMPDIYRICECTASPNIENISIENGSVRVSGFALCNILYIPNDGDTPIAAFSHTLPFEHTFDIPNVKKDSVCDAKSDIGHISYNISTAREPELKINVQVCITVVNPDETTLIDTLERDENAAVSVLPSMLIYFVQSGDTLWDIAKRYKTTPDAIVDTNGKETEILKPGNRIYIFR